LTKEALEHKNANRFRCRECQTEFCASCSTSPYHLGFTCTTFKTYQSSKHCRFCSAQITSKNSCDIFQDPGLKGLVCKDCIEKGKNSCGKMPKCGHHCCGIKDEKECAPCLDEECSQKAKLSQNGEDFCNICWVESLSSSPCIQLKCSHIFHASCCKSKLANKWPGI
jgi:hypothetical protein